MSVQSVFRKVVAFSAKYPVTRGMASYAVIWPVGSLIQQRFINNDGKMDYQKAAKFALYGSCFVAPTLHAWLTLARIMFPHATLSSALSKAIIEQFTYTPFAMVCFYFGMTLLQGGTQEDGVKEVRDKFLPTYKVGITVWPVLQTINYTLISEKNRVVFVSICSLLWTTFLAYMKHLEGDNVSGQKPVETQKIVENVNEQTETQVTLSNPSLTKRQTSDSIWPFRKPIEY